MRYDVIQYVFAHHVLPHGGDPAIRNPMWGFSYAFFPYLSGLVSVVFMKAASVFSSDEQILMLASRMAAVCFGTLNVFYVIKIAGRFFDGYSKWLLVILLGTLPQYVFLSSYMNNDILAILSVSLMLYYCLEGDRTGWALKSRIGLAIGMAVCLLSYYNAYPFIGFSMVFFLWSHRKNNLNARRATMNFVFVATLVFALTAWWFIRNALLYDGDFLGLRTVEHYSNLYAYEHIKPDNRMTPVRQGVSLWGMLFDMKWLVLSAMSSIGVFGYMNIYVHKWIYLFYGLIFCAGLFGVFLNAGKVNKIFFFMLIPAATTLVLSIYNSYLNGFQPQGRYIMPGLLVLMLLITDGLRYWLKEIEARWKLSAGKVAALIGAGSFLASLVCLFGIIVPTYGSL